MFSIINKSPILKDKNSGYRIAIIVLSLICGAFILSPVLTFLLQGQAPLAEMPVGSFYYIIRGLFGITLLIASAILFITGNVTIVAIPSLFGLIASLIPLIDRIQKFIDHKTFIDKFAMTADYTSYLVGIGIYTLYALLCLSTLLYALGILPANLVVLIASALTITAVIFITIDRAKNIEYGIFDLYDIMCFSYTFLAAMIPALISAATKRNTDNDSENQNKPKEKYQPKRMRS